MMLYNHLLTMTAALDRMAVELPQDGPIVESIIPLAPGTEPHRLFREVQVLMLEPGQRQLTPPQIAHLQTGNSLLEIHHVSGHQSQLTLTRLINPHQVEAGLLAAQLDGTALWGDQARETLSSDTDLVVEDGAGRPMYSTFEPAFALPDFRGQEDGAPVKTGPLWTIGGQDHIAGAWSVPLQQLFLMDPWVIVVSQTRESVLFPVTQFRRILLLVTALTSCTAVLLSVVLIRRSLHPLLRLQEGIVRLASGNFSTPVTVHTHDEFEELADSFNGMTESLSRQFRMEESLLSIGQALLSIREPAALADVVLSRISAAISCDATGLLFLDPAHSEPSVLSMQFLGGPSEELTASPCQVTDEHRVMLQAHPDHTLVTSASLPSFLSAMRRPDLPLFALVPIIVADTIGGVLVLGYRQKRRPPADSLVYARRAADLIAMTLLNSRATQAHVHVRIDAAQASKERTTLLQHPSPSSDAHDERLHLQLNALLSLAQDQRVCADPPPALAKQVTELVAQTLAVHFVSIWVYEERTQSLGCLDRYERTTDHHAGGQRLLREDYPNYMAALDQKSILAATETLQEPAFRDLLSELQPPMQGGARLDIPLQTQDKLAGVLSIEYVGSSREWTTDEHRFARAIAHILTLVLDADGRRGSAEGPVNSHPAAQDTIQAKVKFLTAVSHDIRTPLNGVIGMTEVLAHTPLTDIQRRYVDTIHNSAATLLTLISNHLTCSEVENGTLVVHPVPIDLRDLVETTVERLAEPAQRKGLQIHTFYDPSVPTAVMGDPLRIGHILTNLLSNAITFTQTGEVTVSVTQESEGAGRKDIPRIKLDVADTGSGISIERQADVFRSCSRTDNSSIGVTGRAGLGLPLCKQLTECMGGVISLESAIGTGSTFSVILPFSLQSDPPPPVHTEPAFANLCLCAAVSSATARHLLAQYLSAWGIAPHLADTEGEFLECVMTGLATERGPVVAVIDETFDHMTDTEIVRTLFSEPTLRTVKIIRLVSLMRKADAASDMPSAHMQDVTKPIRFQALYHALRTVLTDQPPIGKETGSATDKQALSRRILLGEDNSVNREIALLMLHSMAYSVTVAHTGREVVDYAKQSSSDVILMDCQMPELDGLEATRQIREWERQASRPPIPIIALTAHATQEDRERCLAAGMSDYISKPFTLAQLHAALTFWCSLTPLTEDQESGTSGHAELLTSIQTAAPAIQDSDASLVVDQNAWKSITHLQRPGQPDALATILSLYVTDSHNLVTTLRHGMANGNSLVVQHAAHSLRSRSATLGAVSLSKLCRQFEELSRQGHLEDAEPLLTPLTAAFEHACRIFQAELERRPT